jgi:outer membrane phospholipase A
MTARGLLTALCVLFAPFAHALDFSVTPVKREVAAAGPFEVILTAINDSKEPVDYAPPPRLDLRFLRSDAEQTVSLVREEDRELVTVGPGGFVRMRYKGTAPDDLIGDVVLRPVDLDASAVAIYVIPPETPASEFSRVSGALSPYEPIYFSVGTHESTNARFQISLKFRVFNPESRRVPLFERLYLAYSQTSLWDLEATSKPFRDSSYRPSVFLLDDNVSRWPFSRSRLGLQGGLEHESNGQDGPDSRSINTAFFRPALTFPLPDDYQLTLAPKIYTYLEKEENPDIDDYRGHVDFLVRFGKEAGFMLDTTLRRGDERRTTVQVDFSYPLGIPAFGNLGGFLHLQYFNGYGESMIDYNQKLPWQFRVGLMVTRGMRW